MTLHYIRIIYIFEIDHKYLTSYFIKINSNFSYKNFFVEIYLQILFNLAQPGDT